MKHSYFSCGLLVATIVAVFSSCSTPKDIAYFQDFNMGKSIVVQNPVEIKFKADDEIRILVWGTERMRWFSENWPDWWGAGQWEVPPDGAS